MTNIKLQQFGGMVPRMGQQLLNNENAEYAENALLLSGELRGINGQQLVVDLRHIQYTIQRVYRALYRTGASEWVTFPDPTIDFVKGPLVNDLYDRYYWTSESGPPMMNTLARIANGDDPFLLGVPRPTSPPIVAPQNDGTEGAVEVSRAYVYTFVTAYGEESAPSDATVATGQDDGSWIISNMSTTVPEEELRNVQTKQVYRTVTSAAGGVAYHFVAELPLGQSDFTDTRDTDIVAAERTLESQKYNPPPTDLIGLMAHPNGFLVGFNGRDIHFSEPYRPHAWPVDYVLSTTDPIKGLGVFMQSIAVCTSGFPYIASGTRPDGITFTKAQTPEPCLSDRRGIVSMPFGVYYPGDNGLMLVGPQGFVNATKPLMTKTEWQRDYVPWALHSVRWQTQYVGYWDDDDGVMFGPDEPVAALVELKNVWQHSVIQEDLFSGSVFQVFDNIVYEFNPAFGVPQTYTWRSKEFVTPKPVNFGACKFEASVVVPPPPGGIPPPGGELPPEIGDEYQKFNDVRHKYILNPVNLTAMNAVKLVRTFPDWPLDPEDEENLPLLAENSQPFHDSPLYRTLAPRALVHGGYESVPTQMVFDTEVPIVQDETVAGSLLFRLFADGQLIYEAQILDEGLYRLPSGYKAKRYQFEFVGTVALRSFKIAETSKELEQI